MLRTTRLTIVLMFTFLCVLPSTVGFSQTFKKNNKDRRRSQKTFSPQRQSQIQKRTSRSTVKSNNFSKRSRSVKKFQSAPSRTSKSSAKGTRISKSSPTFQISPKTSPSVKRKIPNLTGKSKISGINNSLKKPILTTKPGRITNPSVNNFFKPGLTNKLEKTPSKTNFNLKPSVINQLNGKGKFRGSKQFENLVGNLKTRDGKSIKPINLGGKIKPLDKKNPAIANSLTGIAKASNLKLSSPLALKAKKAAMLNLSLNGNGHCHWWIDFVIGSHWHWNHSHWWDFCYTPGYWNCWTPCHYNVVYCPPVAGYQRSAWYFGVECMLIPDLESYGIQAVTARSPADRAGLRVGDMIVSINGMSINDESVLRNSIQRSGGQLILGVVREGTEEPVTIEVLLDRVPLIAV